MSVSSIQPAALATGATASDASAIERLPVTELAGVGPARAAAFEKLGVRSVRDLLFLLPRRVATSGAQCTIAQARATHGGQVQVAGVIERVTLQRFGRRSTLRVTVGDGQASIVAVFFNQPYLRKNFVVGTRIELCGRVVQSPGPTLAAPKVGSAKKPLAAPGAILPLYPSTDGLGQEFIAGLCRTAARVHAARVEERVPAQVLARLALVPLAQALADVHEPPSEGRFDAARRRIAFEQLLRLQARLHERSRRRARGQALAVALDETQHAALLARFPFALTAGQRAIAAQLRVDLARRVPMRRLLQGDVGSGKTVLGLYACMATSCAGGQSAFLAPTELLAEQHFDGLRPLLERSGLRGVLLTGSCSAAERRQVLAQLESGMADVAFGTHALFSADVRYRRLALAVIDEQQRFGVAQRAQLFDKGADVHALLMTATPIPRTLALTLYGDLDTSVLAERPPGRGTIRTRWIRGAQRRKLGDFLRQRLEQGEQVYWVVPRIATPEGEGLESQDGAERSQEDAEQSQVGAEQVFEKLRHSSLAAHGIELVHGRIPAAERARRLELFRRGDVKLLVATTVIEVGVDVAAATVMVIENAERLGLAQLHQLRGRIGRGARDAWCLVSGARGAAQRFEFFEQTSDGFLIAEEDLRRRGMGDLSGLRQAGENSEGLSELDLDLDLLFAARDLVAADAALFDFYRAHAQDVATP